MIRRFSVFHVWATWILNADNHFCSMNHRVLLFGFFLNNEGTPFSEYVCSSINFPQKLQNNNTLWYESDTFVLKWSDQKRMICEKAK